ncbi:MAG: peptidoglycan editing factor PgeF [Methylococcales bacterium]|nr:peptidoglycan editing factor PgeF [Methylococcales bacterium]
MRSQKMNNPSYLIPDWGLPPTIHAAMTLRQGGVSSAPYTSLNPATHVNDALEDVILNRNRIKTLLNLPSEPIWLNQTHGTQVIDAGAIDLNPNADASFTAIKNKVCAVLTADCLPILLCSNEGHKIAAIHAGWRGLLAGIIEKTLDSMQTTQVSVWLGAAIGPCCFEVGLDVYTLFVAKNKQFSSAFTRKSSQKYLADIYQLARIDLALKGVNAIDGGHFCTVCDSTRFYSYRRDQQTGRMATLIWKD